jgi:hypothetical protein
MIPWGSRPGTPKPQVRNRCRTELLMYDAPKKDTQTRDLHKEMVDDSITALKMTRNQSGEGQRLWLSTSTDDIVTDWRKIIIVQWSHFGYRIFSSFGDIVTMTDAVHDTIGPLEVGQLITHMHISIVLQNIVVTSTAKSSTLIKEMQIFMCTATFSSSTSVPSTR